jgi:hypothetical protein
MVRKKTTSIDGLEIQIASLTVEQVEGFLEQIKDAEKAENGSRIMKLWKEFICHSLNNAQAQDAEKWTPERLNKEMDTLTIKHLQAETWHFTTGLELQPKTEEPKRGEASAS